MKNKTSFLIGSILIIFSLFSSCKKQTVADATITVTVSETKNGNLFYAKTSGIAADQITEVGFVWSASANPDKSNAFVFINKTVTTGFSYEVLSGLADKATYYVSAYYIDKDLNVHYALPISFAAKGTAGLQIRPDVGSYTWDDEVAVEVVGTHDLDIKYIKVRIDALVSLVPTKIADHKIYFNVPRSITKKVNRLSIEYFGQESDSMNLILKSPSILDKFKVAARDNEIITIAGDYFNPDKNKNLVMIGGNIAEIVSSSKTALNVRVAVPEYSFLSEISVTTGENLTAKTSERSKFYKHFVDMGSFPGEERGWGIALSLNDKLYVGLGKGPITGGQKDLYEYTPSSNTWKKMADFPGGATWAVRGFAANNKIYVVLLSLDSRYTRDVYMFDPGTNLWTKVAPYPSSSAFISNPSTFSYGNYGYLFGGNASEPGYIAPLGQVLRYDASNNTWKFLPTFPGSPRSAATTMRIGDKIYVMGGSTYGYNGLPNYPRDCWEFDLPTEKWKRIADLAAGVGGSNSFSFGLNGKGYVGGGYYTSDSRTNFVYEYNPATDSYTKVDNIIDAIAVYAEAAVVNNKAYIVFGDFDNSNSNPASKSFIQFVP
ncbi:Kelch repeat-containing protein [Pedobacter duraquae]|uniref:Kelch motif protein n=1 Tax=Pedobacter duraquae TaxID=425511 RepID=A0A4R6IGU3_9SPHI|nr:IPT/TIG domain-containing protein [Pedobacter duraquae]TDO21324.1 Kelch motif protein [Pedobacter duraquae]